MSNKNFRTAFALFSGVAVALTGVASARAQDGFKLGSFQVLPTVEVKESFNDNIYNERGTGVSDNITTIQPAVAFNSNFEQHALNFLATGNFGIYGSNSQDDFSDYAFATDGRFDAGASTSFLAGVRYDRLHEDRGSRNNTSGNAPIEYSLTTLNVGGAHAFGDKLRLRGTLVHSIYDYDAQSRQGGTSVSQDFRDRTQTEPTLRLGYQLNPNWEIFSRGSINSRDYDQTTDTSGRRRSSKGHNVVAGLGLTLPGLLAGEAYVGNMAQNYDDARLKDVNTLAYGASINWVPITRMSITLNANRSIDETTTLAASSTVTSSVGIYADIDVMRDLILRPEYSFANSAYNGIAQDDDTNTFGIGLVYSLSTRVYVGGGYKHTERDSNVNTSDYKQNVYFLRLGAKM